MTTREADLLRAWRALGALWQGRDGITGCPCHITFLDDVTPSLSADDPEPNYDYDEDGTPYRDGWTRPSARVDDDEAMMHGLTSLSGVVAVALPSDAFSDGTADEFQRALRELETELNGYSPKRTPDDGAEEWLAEEVALIEAMHDVGLSPLSGHVGLLVGVDTATVDDVASEVDLGAGRLSYYDGDATDALRDNFPNDAQTERACIWSCTGTALVVDCFLRDRHGRDRDTRKLADAVCALTRAYRSRVPATETKN